MVNLTSYILLDGARLESSLEKARNLNSVFYNLYSNSSDEELGDIAPYMFTFPYSEEFSSWIFENGWGNSWGVMFETKISFEECWKHFRKFLLVKTEDGDELYFRFYDPRVLKIFLPTCDKQQILEFFGPIESFIVEGDFKEEAIRYWQQNGELKQEVLPVEKVFGQIVFTESENRK